MKTVSVTFIPSVYNNKLYDFRCYDANVKPDDYAVVFSALNTEPSIVKVVVVHDIISLKATKDIVQLIDLATHREREAKEARRRELREKLNKLKRSQDEMEVFRYLAANNIEAAMFLKELEDLS